MSAAAPASLWRVRDVTRRAPTGVLAPALLVAALVVSPLVFLALEAAATGPHTLSVLVFRSFTAQLLWNTVRLTAAATASCAVVGTGAAWLVERTDLPLRRVLGVVLVIPLAIPDFVVSFGWSSLSPALTGFWGALLVMTLAVYPLVYLPAAASFRQSDPATEEVARSLGSGPWRTFWRVSLGQARAAILGGALLCALVLLAEYGAFEILGYQTFTTEVFTELGVSFDLSGASALALVLVALSLLCVLAEVATRGRARTHRSATLAPRPPQRHALGRWRPLAGAGAGALAVAAVGVPVGTCIFWMVRATRVPLSGTSLWTATGETALYGLAAGVLATLLAAPVALLAVRHPGRVSAVVERATYLVLAVPGIVVALALTSFSLRDLGGFLYQSPPLLVVAYAVLFFPLALVGVRTSLAQAPPGLEEAARSLGTGRIAVLGRVTLPLVAPGLAASFSLVFLSVVTELTATLLLIPTGGATLATQFWAYETNLSYTQAAPYALAMIVLAAIPSVALSRYFDRLARRRATPSAS